jgi:hypothetical protein
MSGARWRRNPPSPRGGLRRARPTARLMIDQFYATVKSGPGLRSSTSTTRSVRRKGASGWRSGTHVTTSAVSRRYTSITWQARKVGEIRRRDPAWKPGAINRPHGDNSSTVTGLMSNMRPGDGNVPRRLFAFAFREYRACCQYLQRCRVKETGHATAAKRTARSQCTRWHRSRSEHAQLCLWHSAPWPLTTVGSIPFAWADQLLAISSRCRAPAHAFDQPDGEPPFKPLQLEAYRRLG